jgi:hypothetical protein
MRSACWCEAVRVTHRPSRRVRENRRFVGNERRPRLPKGRGMKGFKRRRKALEKKSERTRDAKGVRACARDAQTLTPRAGGRVRALRARGTTPGEREARGRSARREREER